MTVDGFLLLTFGILWGITFRNDERSPSLYLMMGFLFILWVVTVLTPTVLDLLRGISELQSQWLETMLELNGLSDYPTPV